MVRWPGEQIPYSRSSAIDGGAEVGVAHGVTPTWLRETIINRKGESAFLANSDSWKSLSVTSGRTNGAVYFLLLIWREIVSISSSVSSSSRTTVFGPSGISSATKAALSPQYWRSFSSCPLLLGLGTDEWCSFTGSRRYITSPFFIKTYWRCCWGRVKLPISDR